MLLWQWQKIQKMSWTVTMDTLEERSRQVEERNRRVEASVIVMIIRRATLKDFKRLYTLGAKTPELQVSATEPFMHAHEFRAALTNRHGIFLLAEDTKMVQGFIYINTRDIDRPSVYNEACLVYLVVAKRARGSGVASALYEAVVPHLKKRGVTHLYAWVTTAHQKVVVRFMERQGFKLGHTYAWMDRKI